MIDLDIFLFQVRPDFLTGLIALFGYYVYIVWECSVGTEINARQS